MTRRSLELRPFRGLRFDPAVVGDLGSVVSPPYDVLDAAIVQQLEHANRHNVVRLILSRYFEPPYRAVRKRLERWREQGYLRADEHPALYLYEYSVDGATVRGLIGLVALRAPEERVILPHEDVMPGPVSDRTLLMRTTETNLEPILLVHTGSPALHERYQRIRARPPLADFTALDGSSHRLWAMTDPAEVADMSSAVAGDRALIADGHHRYAAYLTLQQELAGASDSPWNYGLAMLVADDGAGLEIGPIHRVVRGLTLRDVEEVAHERGDSLEPCAATERLERDAATITFLVSDGDSWGRLTLPRTHDVDAAVLHDELLPAWHVAEDQISYHHSLDQAVRVTQREPSVLVVVDPPPLLAVITAAAEGRRLPRKSTSFSPKPRMGVVMRDLRDD
ncbi:MAG TPA: DUF1015 domain-containing protein [Nocardioidaceae bacterium]|nr:DUF1015 domain-containing protein [Nocardioidaceae bacterium]